MADSSKPRNSVSYLSDARKALGDYARLRKQLALVQADEKITFALHRALWGGGAAMGAVLAIGAAWSWVTVALHARGWAPGALAVLSLLVFGVPAAICVLQLTRPANKEVPR